MNKDFEEFVENCRFTKRELIVLKTVKQVNDDLDKDEPAIMKEIVGNSDIDHKTLHDGWNKLVPKGLMDREEVKTSSKLWITDEGLEALQKLEELKKIVGEAKK